VTFAGRAALLAAALLAACAGVPPGPQASSVSGRLSLQVAANGAEPARGFNAAFDLRGTAEAGELRLSTPLGPQIAAARWAPGEVRLATGEGERRYPSLEALALDALGEPVPLQALPSWLRGEPWPGAPSQPQPAGFAQLGWTLDLSRLAEGFIIALRQRPPAVTLRLRLDPAAP
jgi:outer membrane lipoprotein LolB